MGILQSSHALDALEVVNAINGKADWSINLFKSSVGVVAHIPKIFNGAAATCYSVAKQSLFYCRGNYFWGMLRIGWVSLLTFYNLL